MTERPYLQGATIRTMSGTSAAHLRTGELDDEFDLVYERHYRDGRGALPDSGDLAHGPPRVG